MFASLDSMVYHLEAIDVENAEYDAWDAAGHVLELSVDTSSRIQWLRVNKTDARISDEEFGVLRAKAKELKAKS